MRENHEWTLNWKFERSRASGSQNIPNLRKYKIQTGNLQTRILNVNNFVNLDAHDRKLGKFIGNGTKKNLAYKNLRNLTSKSTIFNFQFCAFANIGQFQGQIKKKGSKIFFCVIHHLKACFFFFLTVKYYLGHILKKNVIAVWRKAVFPWKLREFP